MKCTEGTDFYWIGDSGSSEMGVWVRVVMSLGRCTCVFVFVQLLSPASRLMSDQAACEPREADGTVWGLQFGHIPCVPPHFRFGGQAQNEFRLICAGNEIRDVRVYGVYSII